MGLLKHSMTSSERVNPHGKVRQADHRHWESRPAFAKKCGPNTGIKMSRPFKGISLYQLVQAVADLFQALSPAQQEQSRKVIYESVTGKPYRTSSPAEKKRKTQNGEYIH